ncbi:radical SAM protein [Actinomadura sp. CNU-125]|uniref:B12-binding domain-containing radical SAM protein n=1 Tax=Actinomadura sp. CNU-125 TaxID=1904961 RepID=UPI000966CDB8|nr:radical SAM protein [Actinomadura sp. CNU-125]OLT30498.1 radical SAM protein [Actinomadura sp. CNU-125]
MQTIEEEIQKIQDREIIVGAPYDFTEKPKKPLRVVFLLPYGHEYSLLCMGPLALYDLINRRKDVPAVAERAIIYDCLTEDGQRLRTPAGETYRSIESAAPVAEADIIGVSITNSGDLPSFFRLLDLAGIPRRSEERRLGRHPLVVGGNGGFANPEILGDYLDAIALGEGEQSMLQLIDIVRDGLDEGRPKDAVLERMSQVPGLYVPSMYSYELRPSGGISSVKPRRLTVPAKVHAQYLGVEDLHDAHWVAPIIDGTCGMIVPTLGCRWACHFCTLGVPSFRQAPFDLLMSYIDKLEEIGASQIIISSPTFTQYGKRYRLLDRLREYSGRAANKVTTIIGSVRADELSARYLSAVSELGEFGHLFTELKLSSTRGIVTIAPEFASADLVAMFNKTMTLQRVHKSINLLKENEDFAHIMLYFIVGAPGETREDRAAIADYAVDIFNRFERPDGTIILKLQQFMPKPNTVSQRLPMSDPDHTEEFVQEIQDRLRALVGDQAYERNYRVLWGESSRLLLESVCLRGDRRIGRILERLYDDGMDLTALTGEQLRKVLDAEDLDHSYYLRELSIDEVVPWEVVDSVDTAQEAELIRALKERTAHDASGRRE